MNQRFSNLLHRMRQRFAPQITRLLPPSARFLRQNSPPKDWGTPEGVFETQATTLPVYSGYRYAIKPGWTFFRPLMLLHQLQQRNLSSPSDIQFLATCKGTRTLARSLTEIETYIHQRRSDLEPYLIPGSLDNNAPALIPENQDTQQRIHHHMQSHKRLIGELDRCNLYPDSSHLRLLEIGFISGGHSLFAFEKLGFSVVGIDNGYGGLAHAAILPDHLKTRLGSQVEFVGGDMTETTHLSAESFHIIYSASVLEHIHRIPDAFREMYRLLKPGGLIIHKYNPFFCPSGGHALGILDAPWGHCRLSEQDYLRYIRQYRPHEAESAEAWISGALTRAYPIAAMQRAVSEAHFDIALWRETDIPEAQLADLTPDIMRECFRVNPHIGLSDLISESVLLVARKKG